jgi:hypothetical protein
MAAERPSGTTGPAHDLQLARSGDPGLHWTKVQLAGRNAGTTVREKAPVAHPTVTGNGVMEANRSAVKEETS